PRAELRQQSLHIGRLWPVSLVEEHEISLAPLVLAVFKQRHAMAVRKEVTDASNLAGQSLQNHPPHPTKKPPPTPESPQSSPSAACRASTECELPRSASGQPARSAPARSREPDPSAQAFCRQP